MRRKSRNAWLSNGPPRPWLLWTVRGVLLGVWVLVLVIGVPTVIDELHNLRATMPPGPERQAALDGILEQAVTMLLLPVVLLAIFGFGVGPRKASDVWATGGPWFVPLWRSDQRKARTKRHRASDK